jgi:ATP-dependent helicase HrpB
MQRLPIDPFIDMIVGAVRTSRAAIVTAAPGAGKTTRVPPALLDDGPVLLLQPRRVAARALAARIADERGWTLGSEIGWQIRGERRFGSATRLLVATEGILTARLQRDPLLSDVRTIVLDEFHERSVHADLALALARQAWLARDDLRIIVMSATIESAAIAAFLGDCPVIDVPGRLFPIDIGYEPGRSVANAVSDLLEMTTGDILAFLPGALEIRRTIAELEPQLHGRGVDLVALHGSLDPREQDAALRPSAKRRVIVSKNIAETSSTPDCTRWRGTTPAAASTVSTWSASRRTQQINAPDVPVASRLASCEDSGMRTIACGRIESRRSSASICVVQCST